MNGLALALALFLLVNLAAALARTARGPTAADRMLSALLFGTTGVAILVLLAAIAGVAFVARGWERGKAGPNRD